MKRILIAEDESILAATLSAALQRLWPEAEVVAVCPNGVAAVEQALALRPDVLFLDIKMPGKTGLEAAEEIADAWDGGNPPLVVFVTAYDQYAVDAFDQQAADYVLKPISDARLARTVERLQARLAAPAPADEMATLLAQLRTLAPLQSAAHLSMIRAAVGSTVRMIPVEDVIYFEAADKYVNVVTADSESLIRTSLRELLPQLDAGLFWQVHRGTVVNSRCILAAHREEGGKLSLSLRGRSEKLRVSPLYAHLFRQM